MRIIAKTLALFLTLSCFSQLTAAIEVSTTPPAEYENHIQPLLLDSTGLQQKFNVPATPEDAGIIVHSNQITWVHENGRTTTACHYIYQAYTEKGTEYVSQERFAYDYKLQKLHLAMARTIQPDGSVQNIAANGAFIERGRNESQSQLYNSDQSLVVVYPNVKVGTLVEVIVVYESINPRIDNQFTYQIGFSTGWPADSKSYTIILPNQMHQRLQLDTIGNGIPQLKTSAFNDARTQLSWSKKSLPYGTSENAAAPVSQAGPAVHLSTLTNWDQFASWYQGLADARSGLSDELKSLADKWTKDCKSAEETLEVLYKKVANDVRYLGLEFGHSGLQPYHCNEVWKHQYGDCKDKSNLLRNLLAYKGIHSCLTLVNTEHLGIIPRKTAGFRKFNHAILAVQLENNNSSWIFCDPTIEFGSPGQLSQSSSGRDALIINNGKALWQTIPAGKPNSYHYDFDLTLKTNGQMHGWLTITGSELYSISLASGYHGLDRDSTITRLRNMVSNFVSNAEIIDYILPQSENKKFPNPSQLKLFITIPASEVDAQNNLSIPIPFSSNQVYNYDGDQYRKSDFFQWQDREKISLSILLPQGWKASSLPEKIHQQSNYLDVLGSWKMQGRKCTAKLEISTKNNKIPASQVQKTRLITNQLDSWISQTARIHVDPNSPTSQPELTPPSMPTAEGQLSLIDYQYPINGDIEAREKALIEAMEQFEDQPKKLARVHTRLAYLKYQQHKYDESISLYQDVIDNHSEIFSNANLAFYRYMLAFNHAETGHKVLASQMMEEVAASRGADDYRRGWALTQAANYRDGMSKPSDEALTLYQHAVAIENDHTDEAVVGNFIQLLFSQPAQLSAFIKLHFNNNNKLAARLKLLDDQLGKLDASQLASAASIMISAANQLDETCQKSCTELALSWSQASAARQQFAVTKQALSGFYQRNKERIHELCGDDEIKPSSELDDSQLDSWLVNNYEEEKFTRYLTSHFDFLINSQTNKLSYHLRLVTHSLITAEKNQQVAYADSLLPQIWVVANNLSRKDDHYWKIQSHQARWLAQHKKYKQAITLFQEARKNTDFAKKWLSESYQLEGRYHEILGAEQSAINCYTAMQDLADEDVTICYMLVKAGALQVRLGQFQQALASWKRLTTVPVELWQDDEYSQDISEAIDLVSDEEALLKYWKNTAKWWSREATAGMRRLGVTIDKKPIRLYLGELFDSTDEELLSAAEKSNEEDFLNMSLRVLDYARWSPGGCYDYKHRVIDRYFNDDPKKIKHLYTIFLSLLKHVDCGNPEIVAFAQRSLIANHYDYSNLREARKYLDLYLPHIYEFDRYHQETMVWLYSLATDPKNKSAADECLTTCDRLWKEGITAMSAPEFAYSYTALLINTKQYQKALDVCLESRKLGFKDETNNDAIEKRITQLEEHLENNSSLNKGLQTWFKENKPSWFDAVRPTLLGQSVFDNASAFTTDNAGSQYLSAIKSLILVAIEPEIDDQTRLRAWLEASYQLFIQQATWTEAMTMLEAVISNKDIPLANRTELLYACYRAACNSGKVSEAKKMRRMPAYANLKLSIREELAPIMMDLAYAVRESSADDHMDNIHQLAQGEIDDLKYAVINLCLNQLLRLGEFEKFEEIIQSAKQWKFASDAPVNKFTAIVAMKNLLKKQQPIYELYAALNELIKAKGEEVQQHVSAELDDHLSPYSSSGNSFQQYQANTIAKLTNNFFDPVNTINQPYLTQCIWLNSEQKPDGKLILAASKIILDKADKNHDINYLGPLFLIAARDKQLHQQWHEQLEKHQDQFADNPRINLIYKLSQLYMDGQPEADDLVNITHKLKKTNQFVSFVEYVILLNTAITQQRPDLLTGNTAASKSLHNQYAWRFLPNEKIMQFNQQEIDKNTRDELLDKTLAKTVRLSGNCTDTSNLVWLMTLADHEGAQADIPEAIFDYLDEKYLYARDQYITGACRSWLRQEHEEMLKQARLAIEIEPQNTTIKLLLARALAYNGKYQEANKIIQPLLKDHSFLREYSLVTHESLFKLIESKIPQ